MTAAPSISNKRDGVDILFMLFFSKCDSRLAADGFGLRRAKSVYVTAKSTPLLQSSAVIGVVFVGSGIVTRGDRLFVYVMAGK